MSGIRSVSSAAISLIIAAVAFTAAAIRLATAATEPPSSVSIRWVADPSVASQWMVEASGLSPASLDSLRRAGWEAAQWQRLLPVFAEQGALIHDAGLPPMLGQYEFTRSGLRFRPQFPLDPQIKYRATFWPEFLPGSKMASTPVTAYFTLPTRTTPPSTVVSRIYPSGSVLPENLLKFYLHFSAPMSRGHIYEHIHLKTAEGKLVELPFLELDEELWNPEMTRLTLFIDPGRIKRGVTPLEEIGPALVSGKKFTMEIDRDWKDAEGRPLKQSFQKHFSVGPADREPPDPQKWRIEAPRSHSTTPLAVKFSEPMDHALAQRVIHVVSPSGLTIDGKSELEDHELRWKFLPATPWTTGAYKLLVQTTIEDLAGNNIGKRFEVDLFEGIQRRFTNTTLALPFVVK